MVRIKCVNPYCTGASKTFDWDESKHINPGGGLARPREPGAARVIAVCPFCATANLLWLKGVKNDQPILRGSKPQ